jgi:hypothetical protein
MTGNVERKGKIRNASKNLKKGNNVSCGPMMGFCEHRNEPSGYIKDQHFLDY